MEISSSVFIAIGLQALIALLLPALLGLWLRRKGIFRPRPFFVGCGVFLVFALVLESLMHQLVLRLSPFGPAIQNNLWLYALYGGLAAGVFEECGRYIAFRSILRRDQTDDRNALVYGAGHGGFEVFFLLFTAAVSNLSIAVLVKSGNAAQLTQGLSGDMLAQAEAQIASIAQLTPGIALLALVERCIAVCTQLALSVIVWFSAKDGLRKTGLLFAAIALHAAVDMVAVLLASVLSPVLIELVLAAFALLLVIAARAVWRRYAAV